MAKRYVSDKEKEEKKQRGRDKSECKELLEREKAYEEFGRLYEEYFPTIFESKLNKK